MSKWHCLENKSRSWSTYKRIYAVKKEQNFCINIELIKKTICVCYIIERNLSVNYHITGMRKESVFHFQLHLSGKKSRFSNLEEFSELCVFLFQNVICDSLIEIYL